MKKSDLVLSLPATWDSWPICHHALLEDCEILALAEPRPIGWEGCSPLRQGGYASHLELLENRSGRHRCSPALYPSMPWFRYFECRHEPLNRETPGPLCGSRRDAGRSGRQKQQVTHGRLHKRSDPAMEYAKSIIDQWKNLNTENALYPHHHASGRLDWRCRPVSFSDEPYPP